MRVLLATFGTRGDVLPFVALGQALQAAGHGVTLAGAPDAVDLLPGAALPLSPVGEPYSRVMAELQASPGRATAVMARQVPAQLEALDALVAQADVVVSGSLEYATATLCEAHGVPRRAVLLSPWMAPSADHPMPMVPATGLPAWLNRLTWWLSDQATAASILAPLQAERRRRGLPSAGRASLHLCGEELWLPFPASLCPPLDGALVPTRRLDPWVLHDPARLPPEVERFLDAGEPPAWLGLGSMPVPEGWPMMAAEAARLAGLRALVAGEGPSDAEVHFVRGPLPFARLLPRCAVVVHHGGAGTLVAATRAARPQVVVPFIADQHPHARLVHARGLGGPPVSRRGLDAARLARALARAREAADPAALADHAASAAADGLSEGVALLEALASRPAR